MADSSVTAVCLSGRAMFAPARDSRFVGAKDDRRQRALTGRNEELLPTSLPSRTSDVPEPRRTR